MYEKKTGVTLSKHPLAHSVENFNKLLQDKPKVVRASERITKSMKTILSVLTPLSSVDRPVMSEKAVSLPVEVIKMSSSVGLGELRV